MIVDVYEAVTSRRAVRAFTDQLVPKKALERVLSAAAWSPSGSNLQPWRASVLTGAPLAELKKRAGERLAAPAALFCYIDRDLCPPQWSDIGM